MALVLGDPLYRKVRAWSADTWIWTRRASILVHLIPARKQALAHDWAWPTFAELLPEQEFFIRKAIGWTLRECGKHYAERVVAFLNEHDEQVSGLSFREGSRNLPAKWHNRLVRVR